MKTLFTTILLLASFITYCQESVITELNTQLLQRYIALAKQNYPRKKTFDARVERAHANVNMAKLSYLDIFNVGYYYRPDDNSGLAPVQGGGGVTPVGNTQIVTRGFQAGVGISLGSILSRPSAVRAAKADYKAATAENMEYDKFIENEVKARYYDYLLMKKQLQLRNLSTQTLRALLTESKLKYERAEIAIDVYTASRTAATESEATLLAAEVAYLKSKNALEELIGVTLESVN